jgi:hypothetical protein
MSELFSDFEWGVFPAYHWQDWLDSSGRPITITAADEVEALASLDSSVGVEFAWDRFKESKEKPGPVLGPDLDSGAVRMYRPMERRHAALFQRFVALDYRDGNALLAFARTYGCLSAIVPTGEAPGGQSQQVVLPDGSVRNALGEPQLTWEYEICLMKKAMQLTQRPEGVQADIDAAYKRRGMDPEHRRTEDAHRLDWLFNVHLQHVQPRMSFRDRLPPRLSYAPLTLLAAMWWQLALAVVDDKRFEACKFCRNLFEISTAQTGFRSHREFCSDSCKTQDYRRRKRTALRLLGEGQPVSKVAKQVGTPVQTVRSWKQAAKSRKKPKRDS